ncbi:hypothetical protein RFI_20820 [Reticulomyxa filosa]|uniref:Protein kinase domain-containing protein n=1 Tax=Reticulomyxa filosa TaxID=46433 RepID=X6MR89_RETFI|nr:hypothetical protein RFI_20820 [Reticulomyxa filosa]|eukprot:ETO16513.1 hypothetical protein RFI_20820 [Reticulomyxa filosa]
MLMCNKNGCYSENGYVAESATLTEESDDEMILNKWSFSMSISAKSILPGSQSMHNDGTQHKEGVYADTETLSSFVHSASGSPHGNEHSNICGTQSLSTVTEAKLSTESASKGKFLCFPFAINTYLSHFHFFFFFFKTKQNKTKWKGIRPKKYKIVKQLMTGSSSTVYVVQSDEPENSNQFYAMKIIPVIIMFIRMFIFPLTFKKKKK